MKLKRTDLELLMSYLEKEKPESVEVLVHEDGFKGAVGFAFEDAEKRSCVIKLFDSLHNVTPELQKTMKLYTRTKKADGKTEQN